MSSTVYQTWRRGQGENLEHRQQSRVSVNRVAEFEGGWVESEVAVSHPPLFEDAALAVDRESHLHFVEALVAPNHFEAVD
jgi:hypothetical protein